MTAPTFCVVTPAQLRAAQRELGWTDAALARFLRLGAKGDRTVRRWRADSAKRGVPGPVQVAVELALAARRRPLVALTGGAAPP